MIRDIIAVGIGGGFGSIIRYLVTISLSRTWTPRFPFATFLINISGCLLIGLLLGIFQRVPGIPAHIKLLFATGFCGGYTTFSAFAAENIQLFQSGNGTTAWVYMAASILGGLLAVGLGIWLVKA